MTIQEKIDFLKPYTKSAWYYEIIINLPFALTEREIKQREFIITEVDREYEFYKKQSEDSNLHQL